MCAVCLFCCCFPGFRLRVCVFRAGLCYYILRVCVAAVFVVLLVLPSCFSMSRLLLSGVVVDAGLCRCCAVVSAFPCSLWCFLCVFVSLFAVIVVNSDNGFVLLLAPRVYALSDRLCAGVCARAFCFCLAVAVSLISVRPLCFAARACLVCVHVFVRGCCRLQSVPVFVFVVLVLPLSLCVVVVCARCFCCCRC